VRRSLVELYGEQHADRIQYPGNTKYDASSIDGRPESDLLPFVDSMNSRTFGPDIRLESVPERAAWEKENDAEKHVRAIEFQCKVWRRRAKQLREGLKHE